jgi:hypothetical protein
MYLEISARQSGKTYRMIKIAARLLKQGKRVMFVTRTQGAMRSISEMLWRLNAIPKGVVVTFTTYQSYKTSIRGQKPFDATFFDEFDFAGTPTDSSFILKNGYYSTTPAFIRSTKYLIKYLERRKSGKKFKFDLLVELVIAKKYKFKNYRPINRDMIYEPWLSYNETLGSWRTLTVPGDPSGLELPRMESSLPFELHRSY